MFTTCGILLTVGLIAIFALIFLSDWLPDWFCDYLGHHQPKEIYISKENSSIRIGKCSRCGKLVQNDIDYPNDVWY